MTVTTAKDSVQEGAESSEKPADQTAEKQGDPADQPLGEPGKKALDAERQARADAEKRLRDLEAQLNAANDEKLTETEKLQKQLNELQEQYETAQRTALRDRVAMDEQVPASLVGYLAGTTEAELRASAQGLTAAIAEAAKPGSPKPDPSQGGTGTTPPALNSDGLERALRAALGA